jgi:hypothetical protein
MQEALAARERGRIRQSDEDIQTEIMASWMTLLNQFGDVALARGAVGNGSIATRVALNNNMSWDDALRFGRAVLLHTVNTEKPGELPSEAVESVRAEFGKLRMRYGVEAFNSALDGTHESVVAQELASD